MTPEGLLLLVKFSNVIALMITIFGFIYHGVESFAQVNPHHAERIIMVGLLWGLLGSVVKFFLIV